MMKELTPEEKQAITLEGKAFMLREVARIKLLVDGFRAILIKAGILLP